MARARHACPFAAALLLLFVATQGNRAGAATFQAARVVPNDPLFASAQGYLQIVRAPEAWAVQAGDPGVIVAVLDDGVDTEHPDLAANIWTNAAPGSAGCANDVHGCSFVEQARGGTCPPLGAAGSGDVSPRGQHGTFVAGVIGAAGNNGTGIAGMAWNVSLMPVRVVDCHGAAAPAAIVAGIHYAIANGARVIDLSAGSPRSAGSGCRAPSQILADAVQYAKDRGVLIVAPAGDRGQGCVDEPAAVYGVLAVAGTTGTGTARWAAPRGAQGSNWGPGVVVAAPADQITSTVPLQTGAAPPNDYYASSSSTSYAAAIVSGEAALLLSQNPLLTPDWLSTLIALGAHPLADGSTPGWAGAGLVDIAASLALVPAGFSGAVTIDGAPAPAGTAVQAYIGSVLCAESATFTQDGNSVYALIVPAARMQQGCGAAGATVQLQVDGVPATSALWQPTATTLDLAIDSSGAEPALHFLLGGRR